VIQEWLFLQAYVELFDWPPRGPDMKPIENMWNAFKGIMLEIWPVLPPRNSDALWTLTSDACDEVASSKRQVRSLTESCREECNRWLKHRDSWLLIEKAICWKQPLYRTTSKFPFPVRKRNTPRNKTPVTRVCFTNNSSVYCRHVKVGARGPHAAHIHYFGGSRIVAEQTVNIVQKLQLIKRNIQLSKFVKSIIRLLGESFYFL